jgi:hypothetical protein
VREAHAGEVEGDIPRMVVRGRYPSLHERLKECPCLAGRQDLARVALEMLVLGERLAGWRWQLRDIGMGVNAAVWRGAARLGRITLDDALALTALVAEKDPERRSRFAARWLRRLLEEERPRRRPGPLAAATR